MCCKINSIKDFVYKVSLPIALVSIIFISVLVGCGTLHFHWVYISSNKLFWSIFISIWVWEVYCVLFVWLALVIKNSKEK